MNIKDFLMEVNTLNNLLTEPNSFSTRRKIRKSKKAIRKMIEKQAKQYADIVYNQTIKSGIELANDNLSQNLF